MQRPPKPTFKSAQIFNHPIRKLMNPQTYLPETKNLMVEENFMTSMRESSNSNYVNKIVINNNNA